MSDIRILFAGPRDWPASKAPAVHAVLDEAVPAVMAGWGVGTWGTLLVTLVSGHCPTGADPMAEAYASHTGWAVEPHPALWDECGHDCPTTPHRIRRRPDDTTHPGVLPTYCPK